jgi:hypothetical protein
MTAYLMGDHLSVIVVFWWTPQSNKTLHSLPVEYSRYSISIWVTGNSAFASFSPDCTYSQVKMRG